MPPKKKDLLSELTEEQLEDQKIMSYENFKGIQQSNENAIETNTYLYKAKMIDILVPVILKLLDDGVITLEEKEALIDLMLELEYVKLINALKKYPKYFKPTDKQEEDIKKILAFKKKYPKYFIPQSQEIAMYEKEEKKADNKPMKKEPSSKKPKTIKKVKALIDEMEASVAQGKMDKKKQMKADTKRDEKFKKVLDETTTKIKKNRKIKDDLSECIEKCQNRARLAMSRTAEEDASREVPDFIKNEEYDASMKYWETNHYLPRLKKGLIDENEINKLRKKGIIDKSNKVIYRGSGLTDYINQF
jgi:hypothetical protein